MLAGATRNCRRKTRLGLRVRISRHNNANGKQDDSSDLDAGVSLPVETTSDHSSDAPPGTEDDMHRNRYIITERVVVQHIDTEEENDVDQPSSDGDLVRSDKERRASFVELGDVARGGHKDELNESQERSAGWLDLDDCFEGKDVAAAL